MDEEYEVKDDLECCYNCRHYDNNYGDESCGWDGKFICPIGICNKFEHIDHIS